MTKPEMTHEEALKRACLWLSALIEAAECEPDETTIKISVKGAGDVHVIETINLGDDLRAFQKLGVRTDLLEGIEFE